MQLVTRWYLRDIESKEVWAIIRVFATEKWCCFYVQYVVWIWAAVFEVDLKVLTLEIALHVRHCCRLIGYVDQRSCLKVWNKFKPSIIKVSSIMRCPFSISLPLNRVRVCSSCEKKHSKWNVYVPYWGFPTFWLLLDCFGPSGSKRTRCKPYAIGASFRISDPSFCRLFVASCSVYCLTFWNTQVFLSITH